MAAKPRSRAKREGGGAQPRLLHCYFRDQARPIGTGWRWVFVKLGTKWVFVCDPWNRYTIRLPLRHKRLEMGWLSVGVRLRPAEPAFVRDMLAAAQKHLRYLIADTDPTGFEAECLKVEEE